MSAASFAVRFRIAWPAVLLLTLCSGCSVSTPSTDEEVSSDEVVDYSELTPLETDCIKAGLPFYEAIARADYDAAYDMLSDYARASVNTRQFGGGDESTAKMLESMTKEQFRQNVERMLKSYGRPNQLSELYVESSDPDILAGKLDPSDQLSKVEVTWAIGMMPESTPTEIRRAALRGEIWCKLTPEAIQEIAKTEGVSKAEIEANAEDIEPYFNLKAVIVEEPKGVYKVGYFEFVPPSIWD